MKSSSQIDYRIPPITDPSGWSLLDALIAGDLDTVVDRLIEEGDIATAILIARDDEKLMRRAVTAHVQSEYGVQVGRLIRDDSQLIHVS